MISAIVHLTRLSRVGFVLAREGALGLVETDDLPPFARFGIRAARIIERRNAGGGAERLAVALRRLGPSYVKFGQFLATRPDVVGTRAARDLESLQDKMPPFDQKVAEKIIENTLGVPVSKAFLEFGPPIAAASIAQVHRARLTVGEEQVAVKVLRPGVRERFARDLGSMRFAADLIQRVLPDTRRLRPVEVVETLARSVTMEMDLRLEAAALSEMGENTRDDPEFRVPLVEWDATGRDVMTSSWVDGIPLSDIPAIEAAGHDKVALARVVIQSFLRHALRDGFFHADMHPGNLFVDPEGRLVAVDCGIMGRLGRRERRFLAEILLGFITRDYRRTAQVHFEAGYVPPHHSVDDFAQAIRAIGEPIHNRRADEISMAKLLTLLFEVTALFDMETRTELVMLQKTMVVVEGVARKLDPHLDMWGTAEPVVREWIERNLGPAGIIADAGRGAQDLGGVVTRLPSLLARGERVFARFEHAVDHGFRLSPESTRSIGKAEARGNRGITTALWVIAVLLLISLF
ncbi:2-polyprenylphenol 6-hydroxylase [Pseudochelatococcus contaminans]|uniref:Ubiquinone biosynthesis protein n=1 Tax=Pseudochelatococcus contaminans TaxID=1538103 RepID=A0A7W5Z4S9_9HYPH|nr:2-polyprenylphenol 6-hydroxylase [Pseudochelatococcus contaminans]MBB3810188.1 ubiquinone biosynthesis protein [Pseudochelatococcus contaminans]